MCTVVLRWAPGTPLRVLALRDEFAARAFDEPGPWWPEHASVIGGRDRVAGGTWCASDPASGATALVVNRIERFEGTPSRGRLPLAALAGDWTADTDVTGMAAFNLLLAGPDAATVWVWDGSALRRLDLAPGTHMITSSGVDTGDAKTRRFLPRFDTSDWRSVVDGCEPSDAEGALVVRHEHERGVYATVFGQLITSVPGVLRVEYSRTPWAAQTWRNGEWTSRVGDERLET